MAAEASASERLSGRPLDVLVIGGGFAGLCMAIRLRQSGVRHFAVLERADEVGGTWRDNTYPGCACDIPSHLYSYSFEPNPHWSRAYPSQPEIQGYLRRCVQKYGIAEHLVTRAEVGEAHWDEQRALWEVRCNDGRRFEARVVVSATGPLSKPALPAIPGLERFAGPSFHSARWRHDVDLRGRRVAAIGTGASAIQFVPEIAPEVARLHVFQRTPAWIVPRRDGAFSEARKRRFERWPLLQRLLRARLYWAHEARMLGFHRNSAPMRLAARMALRHLGSQVRDPELREALTPRYRFGCKRVLISNDFHPALTRENVELVTDPIVRITRTGIVTRSGAAEGAEYEREVDAIVFGTGFRATEFVSPMKIFGRDGRELSELWRDGAEAYLGIAVSGFPNLFLLIGPNTGLGHNSMIFMIEAQVQWVMRTLGALRRRGAASVEVRAEVQRAFSARLQERLARTVWLSGCRSWYLGPDGRNFTLWPGYTVEYWLRTRRVREGALQFLPAPPSAPPLPW